MVDALRVKLLLFEDLEPRRGNLWGIIWLSLLGSDKYGRRPTSRWSNDYFSNLQEYLDSPCSYSGFEKFLIYFELRQISSEVFFRRGWKGGMERVEAARLESIAI